MVPISALNASTLNISNTICGKDNHMVVKLESRGEDLVLPIVSAPSNNYQNATAESKAIDTASTPGPVSESLVFQRPMGDTELSYYLSSRADGVGDMYAHLGFRAPPHLFSYWRVRAAWTFLLLQNPPLASRVLFPSSPSTPGDYKNCSFVYTPPESFVAAFEKADATFELKYGVGKDALIDKFLNGERTLNEEKLCCIVLSEHEEEIEGQRNYDLLICAAHFLGDGMALYRFANDFFTLLAGRPSTPKGGEDMSTKDIEAMVRAEWEFRWGVNVMTKNRGQRVLPVSVEDCLPPVNGKFKQAAAKVDFRIDQRKYIGAHTFPRSDNTTRHATVPTVPFDVAETRKILKSCKTHGVSVANSLFALCALAWARVRALESAPDNEEAKKLPIMMYSALNLRPYLQPSLHVDGAPYWFVAIGYFNVVLPSFLPSLSTHSYKYQVAKRNDDMGLDHDMGMQESDILHSTFWHRARLVKAQISRAAKHPLLVSRVREMAHFRAELACARAAKDDARVTGAWIVPSVPSKAASPDTVEREDASKPWKLPPAPSTALLGLSLLGNLDERYTQCYPALTLHTLTTGGRQRPGTLHVFGHTMGGRLWLSLGYDQNAFKEGVVEGWWEEVLKGVNEFLAV